MDTDLSLDEARATVARRAAFCLDPEHATILIADDSAIDRRIMSACLDRMHWPARTVYAADGEEAWAMLPSLRPPVMVVSDFHMPRCDGLELLRRIRADSRTMAVPTVLISAEADQETVASCMAAGATGFFPKPEDAGQTLALVKTLHAFAFQHCFTEPPAVPGH